jgi:hypothetical protein
MLTAVILSIVAPGTRGNEYSFIALVPGDKDPIADVWGEAGGVDPLGVEVPRVVEANDSGREGRGRQVVHQGLEAKPGNGSMVEPRTCYPKLEGLNLATAGTGRRNIAKKIVCLSVYLSVCRSICLSTCKNT